MNNTEKCWLCDGKGKIGVTYHTVTCDYPSGGNLSVHQWLEEKVCVACGGMGKDLPFALNISY